MLVDKTINFVIAVIINNDGYDTYLCNRRRKKLGKRQEKPRHQPETKLEQRPRQLLQSLHETTVTVAINLPRNFPAEVMKCGLGITGRKNS